MIEEESLTRVNGLRPTRLARRLVPGRHGAALMRGDGLGQHVQYGPIAKRHPPGRLRVGLRRLNSHGRLNERQNVPELNVRYLLNPHVERDDRARAVDRAGPSQIPALMWTAPVDVVLVLTEDGACVLTDVTARLRLRVGDRPK
jgi:hypothetical protein